MQIFGSWICAVVIVGLFDWLIDLVWLIEAVNRLTDRLIDRLVDVFLIDWLIDCFGWLVDWPIDWLIDLLASYCIFLLQGVWGKLGDELIDYEDDEAEEEPTEYDQLQAQKVSSLFWISGV